MNIDLAQINFEALISYFTRIAEMSSEHFILIHVAEGSLINRSTLLCKLLSFIKQFVQFLLYCMSVALVEVQENLHVFMFDAIKGKDVTAPEHVVANDFLEKPFNVLYCSLCFSVKYLGHIHVLATFLLVF